MENLFLTAKEHKVLKKHKYRLEKSHAVEIRMPYIGKASSPTDMIFATIHGRKEDIKIVKNFISRSAEKKESKMNNIVVVTLSDNEESSNSEHETSSMSVQLLQNEQSSGQSLRESVIIIDEVKAASYNSNSNTSEESIKMFQKAGKIRQNVISSSVGCSERSEIPSTTIKCNTKKRRKGSVKSNDDAELAPDFLPLNIKCDSRKVSSKKNKSSAVANYSNGIERPLKVPRCLRPIVIDGSNVAKEHGNSTNTFSSKGILMAIKYFINRGHHRITAFVPLFRRHRVHGPCPTSDREILESLHAENHVVFTPSRKLNGKCLASYHNRLLQYCFVKDLFMVPDDPLGRYGPSLDDYLSFPNAENNDVKEISIIELS